MPGLRAHLRMTQVRGAGPSARRAPWAPPGWQGKGLGFKVEGLGFKGMGLFQGYNS